MRENEPDQRTREVTERIYEELSEDAPECMEVHGDRTRRAIEEGVAPLAAELRRVKAERERWHRLVTERSRSYHLALDKLVEIGALLRALDKQPHPAQSKLVWAGRFLLDLVHEIVGGIDPAPIYHEGEPHWERPCIACGQIFLSDFTEQFCTRCKATRRRCLFFQFDREVVVEPRMMPDVGQYFVSERAREIALYTPDTVESMTRTAEVFKGLATWCTHRVEQLQFEEKLAEALNAEAPTLPPTTD